jgi:hypothetical protein
MGYTKEYELKTLGNLKSCNRRFVVLLNVIITEAILLSLAEFSINEPSPKFSYIFRVTFTPIVSAID